LTDKTPILSKISFYCLKKKSLSVNPALDINQAIIKWDKENCLDISFAIIFLVYKISQA